MLSPPAANLLPTRDSRRPRDTANDVTVKAPTALLAPLQYDMHGNSSLSCQWMLVYQKKHFGVTFLIQRNEVWFYVKTIKIIIFMIFQIKMF